MGVKKPRPRTNVERATVEEATLGAELSTGREAEEAAAKLKAKWMGVQHNPAPKPGYMESYTAKEQEKQRRAMGAKGTKAPSAQAAAWASDTARDVLDAVRRVKSKK